MNVFIYVFRCVILYQIEKESEDTCYDIFNPTFAVFTCNQITTYILDFFCQFFIATKISLLHSPTLVIRLLNNTELHPLYKNIFKSILSVM